MFLLNFMSWITDFSMHKEIHVGKMNLLNIDYWRFGISNTDKSYTHYKTVSEFLILPTCGSETIEVLAGAV